jgi:hypothetical protein
VRKEAAAGRAWIVFMLVAALTILALTIDLLTGKPEPLATRIAALAFITLAVPLAVVGALIAARRPGNRVGILLLVAGLSIGVVAVAEKLTSYGVRAPGTVPGLGLIGWVSNLAWVPAILVLLLLPVLFPDGQPPSPRWRPVVWAIVAGAAVTTVLAALIPTIAIEPSLRSPLALPDPAGAAVERVLRLLFLGIPVAAAIAMAAMIVRFRRARGVERQQLKWLAYAGGVVVVASAAEDTWLGGWPTAAATVLLWAIPAAIGIAILRYHLYDIDRIINRTLVYGLLTALLAGVYAGAVLVLGQAFGGVGKDPPSWAVAGATLAVAALFRPTRRRIQQAVDRRFNRRRYDAVRTVEAFSARLRQEIDLEALSAELLAVVNHTMQPTAVSLWLRPPTHGASGAARAAAEPPLTAERA